MFVIDVFNGVLSVLFCVFIHGCSNLTEHNEKTHLELHDITTPQNLAIRNDSQRFHNDWESLRNRDAITQMLIVHMKNKLFVSSKSESLRNRYAQNSVTIRNDSVTIP